MNVVAMPHIMTIALAIETIEAEVDWAMVGQPRVFMEIHSVSEDGEAHVRIVYQTFQFDKGDTESQVLSMLVEEVVAQIRQTRLSDYSFPLLFWRLSEKIETRQSLEDGKWSARTRVQWTPRTP